MNLGAFIIIAVTVLASEIGNLTMVEAYRFVTVIIWVWVIRFLHACLALKGSSLRSTWNRSSLRSVLKDEASYTIPMQLLVLWWL
jgi:hypothetical protein